MYYGDIRLGDTIDIKFTTRQISGAPFTLAGSPVVSAYVGNGTTQITAGITLSVDFDGVTGLNNVRVVASSGNGFATATNVQLVITTGTVNSVSVVGEVIGSFSIEARSAVMPTTAGRTLDVSAGGEAGLDWANIGSPTTAQNLSGTNIDVDQVVASVSGNVGGNVTGSVGTVNAIAANAITAAATASDFGTEIAAAVWDRVITGANHNITNSAGKRLREISNSIVTSGTAQAGGTASITLASGASSTDGTYDPAIVRISAGTGIGQARLIIQYVGSTRVASVDRDWRVTPDNTSEYEIIASQNLISTNEGLATAGGGSTITLNASASATDNVYVGQTIVLRTGTGQDQSRIITGYVGSTKVATVATPWETNPASGTGYIIWPLGRARVTSMEADVLTASALASDAGTEIGTAVWGSGTRTLTALDEDTTTLDLDATIRAAVGLASANLDTQLDALPTAAENTTAVWAAGARTLTAIDEDSTTLDLDATIRAAVGLASANLDTQIGTLATATNLATVDTVVDAIKVTTDKLDDTLEDSGGGAYIFTTASLVNAPGGGGLTVQDIVDGVWDEPMADHLDSGTTGASLNGAGSAGDPWGTSLPGAYGSGTAGFIVGTNLNATVSSRATQTSVDDLPTNAELATALASADDAVLAAIGDLPTNAELATALDAIPTAVENADALLNRDMSAGTDSGSPTVRTPRQALRILRNRWVIDGSGEQTIYKEDDSTASWTQQLTGSGTAEPVVSTDPAGP